jgi:hypothetical protein
LGLENKEPSYAKPDDDEDKDKVDNVDEDDDFERDEDEGETTNVMEEEDDLKKNTNNVLTNPHSIAVKVNINVTPINSNTLTQVNETNKAEHDKKQDFSTRLLDNLFSFIGT